MRIELDEKILCYKIFIEKFDETTLLELIGFTRLVKQIKVNFIVLIFENKLKKIDSINSVAKRLEWSKLGQKFTFLFENLPLPKLSIVKGICFNEYAEVALSCDEIWVYKGGKIEFTSSDNFKEENIEFKFGSIKRFYWKIGGDLFKIINDKSELIKIINKFFNIKKINYTPSKQIIKKDLEFFSKKFKSNFILMDRLLRINLSRSPKNTSSFDYLEATIFANKLFLKKLNEIKYDGKVKFHNKIGDILDLKDGLDDLGNDYMTFKYYPDHEINTLTRKNRIEEVKLLLKQNLAPIHGNCVELGSGYGYFSCLASKKKEVTKMVALDISTAEIYQLGPFMWEYLKPDWNKLEFRIADMNKLSKNYEKFDTVIFCASLHHSSDILKSLKIANSLLKIGGSLIIHGEHYDPLFFKPKKRIGSTTPHTINDFKRLLFKSGFHAIVYRFMYKTNRYIFLKKLIFTIKPFCIINGLFKFSNFMMLGKKKS